MEKNWKSIQIVFNPMLHGGGVQSTRTCRWSCVTPWRTLQMSSYFMTLFLLTFPRTPWGHFSKKNSENFENSKKVNFSLRDQRVPPLDQNRKNFKICGFFSKNHTFSSWIWILHVLSFLLMYITYIFQKFLKFSFF